MESEFAAYRFSIAGCDSIVKKKIELYRERTPDVQLFFGPVPDVNCDLCIVPDKHVPGYFSGQMELLLPPLIAYGPAESMALALAAGCDDYLCEPWSPAELFNRGIRSVTSTALHVSGNSLICGPDRVLRQTAVPAEKNILKVSPQSIRLTRAEAMILKVLIRNKGRFISRSVFAGLLGCSTVNGSRAVDMHVSRLRKKVSALIRENCNDQPDCPIRSASGYGWTIDP